MPSGPIESCFPSSLIATTLDHRLREFWLLRSMIIPRTWHVGLAHFIGLVLYKLDFGNAGRKGEELSDRRQLRTLLGSHNY